MRVLRLPQMLERATGFGSRRTLFCGRMQRQIFKAGRHLLPIAPGSFAEALLARIDVHAKSEADKIAVIDGVDSSMFRTFRDVHTNSYSVAAFLRNELKLKHGEFACSYLPNSIDMAAITLGTTLNGSVLSLCSGYQGASDLARQINDSQCKVVFTSTALLPNTLEARKSCPSVQHIVLLDSPISVPSTVIPFEELRTYEPDFGFKQKINEKEDMFVMPYSSGTTGLAKGVMLTHRNYSACIPNYADVHARNIYPFMQGYDCTKEAFLLHLPMFHCLGFSLLMQSLYQGNKGVVLSKIELPKLCKVIQDHKVRTTTVVPPILLELAKNPIVDEYDLSSLEVLFVGAAPSAPEVGQAIYKRFPNMKFVGQGFGMSETTLIGAISSVRHNTPFESVGGLFPGSQCKIIDVETGELLGPNKQGELWLKGDLVMKGYWNRPEATKETLLEDGWLRTGDIAYMSKEGNLFIVDRLKELIKVKGLQVPPAELEALLLTHAGVRDAAVIGVPCPRRGEVPRAFVVPKPDANLEKEEVAKFVEDRVPRYKRLLGGVVFMDQIPKSPSGKILRRFLREK